MDSNRCKIMFFVYMLGQGGAERVILNILILIAFILWHIPFIKNYLIDLYNNNIIFHMIGSLIANIINIFI